jgi:carbon-monoxide dehydrogenase small subunit
MGTDRNTDLAGISLSVNGRPVTAEIEARTLLVDFLREGLGLTGTHTGCTTSQCGACVILMDGRSIKACTVLAVQADGSAITTIEGLANDGALHPIQAAFHHHHALQCGYCTPGMVMSACDLLARNPVPDDAAIRDWLGGNLCRCTGYQTIVDAIKAAARTIRG